MKYISAPPSNSDNPLPMLDQGTTAERPILFTFLPSVPESGKRYRSIIVGLCISFFNPRGLNLADKAWDDADLLHCSDILRGALSAGVRVDLK